MTYTIYLERGCKGFWSGYNGGTKAEHHRDAIWHNLIELDFNQSQQYQTRATDEIGDNYQRPIQ